MLKDLLAEVGVVALLISSSLGADHVQLTEQRPLETPAVPSVHTLSVPSPLRGG